MPDLHQRELPEASPLPEKPPPSGGLDPHHRRHHHLLAADHCILQSILHLLQHRQLRCNLPAFQFYRDGIYETSSANRRVDARIRKRHSDLTASRGELIEVNIESAFEPIIQGYIIFPNIIDIFDKIGNMVTINSDGKVEIQLKFTTVETAQVMSIITSMVSLAWCYSEYQSVRKNMLLDIMVSPCSRVTMFLYMLMQIIARLLAFQVSNRP